MKKNQNLVDKKLLEHIFTHKEIEPKNDLEDKFLEFGDRRYFSIAYNALINLNILNSEGQLNEDYKKICEFDEKNRKSIINFLLPNFQKFYYHHRLTYNDSKEKQIINRESIFEEVINILISTPQYTNITSSKIDSSFLHKIGIFKNKKLNPDLIKKIEEINLIHFDEEELEIEIDEIKKGTIKFIKDYIDLYEEKKHYFYDLYYEKGKAPSPGKKIIYALRKKTYEPYLLYFSEYINDGLNRLINKKKDDVKQEEYNSELFNDDRIKDNIRDYAFKEILSLILKNEGFENNCISLAIVDSCITKCALYYNEPSDDAIERIRTDIVKAFKILGIFTGYEKDFGYKLIHIKDNTYRMNPFTKVETIKNILGSLSDFTNEKISRENIELVLKIFNFSKIEK